jgi:flagellar protein FliS
MLCTSSDGFSPFFCLIEVTVMTMSAKSISATTALDDITPYQVIHLLLDGALERVDQAISRLGEGDIDEAAILVQKTIGIVGGLRDSLDMEAGGEIANNLDTLYEYIVARLDAISDNGEPIAVLDEVRKLLSEVHTGWVGIAAEVLPQQD